MTYAPATLTKLMAYWVAHGGVNSGIVGDAPHAATGTSYHLGKSQLTPDAYSIQLARDKAGLTEAASAIDFGRLDGSLVNLQKFSRWLVYQLQHADRSKAPWRDVREVIYSPDGKEVRHWNALYPTQLFLGGDGTGHGDDTHLWHTHISMYRDSEFRDKVALISGYFAAPAPEVDVAGLLIALDITAATTPEARAAAIGTASIVGGGHDLVNPALKKADILDVADGMPLGVCLMGTALEAMSGIAKGERLVVYNAGPAGAAAVHVSPLRDTGSTFKPLAVTIDKTHNVEVRVDGTTAWAKAI